jgi:uncharacterized membrane protein (UPF0127 family)
MRKSYVLALALILTSTLLAQVPSADSPQPKLPTITLSVGDKTLSTEVADNEEEREKGMMFRKEMPDGTAMLFVLDAPQKPAFWMRNTFIPLSVAYVNTFGMIMEIHDLQPKDERPVSADFDSILYAIEVPQGWFSKNGILPGTMVKGLPAAPRQ